MTMGHAMKAAFLIALAAAAGPIAPAMAAQNNVEVQQLSYADLADLGAGAPIVAHLRIRGAERLGARDAANVPAGFTRFQIEADVVALLRGTGGLSGRVRYLVD